MTAGGKTGGEGGNNAGGGTGTLKDNGAGGAIVVDAFDVSPGATGQPGEEAEVEQSNVNHLLKSDRTKPSKPTIPAPSTSPCPVGSPTNTCLACRRVVLGHPLDTIRYRCGGCIAVPKCQGKQHIAAEAAEIARASWMSAFQVAPVAGSDSRNAVKHPGFGSQPKPALEAGSSRAGPSGGRRGKRNGSVGAAAVSQVRLRQQLSANGMFTNRKDDKSVHRCLRREVL